jgi:hypothetical protein
VQKAVECLDWVARARVRLREHGDILTGEVFIQPQEDRDLLARMAEARTVAESLDWRLHDLCMVPVQSVD